MIEIQYTSAQISDVVEKLNALTAKCCVITLIGTIGAGKTTLATQLLRSYGVTEHITSPTFTYVNIYHGTSGRVLYHFDLYRMHTVDEFFAAGFDEYLYQPKSIAIVEWPEVIMPLLTHGVCHITLEHTDDAQSRRMVVSMDIKN